MAAYYINLERGYSWVPNKSDTVYDDVLKLARTFGAKHVWSAPFEEGLVITDSPQDKVVLDVDGQVVWDNAQLPELTLHNNVLDAWGWWRERGYLVYNHPATGDEFGFSM